MRRNFNRRLNESRKRGRRLNEAFIGVPELDRQNIKRTTYADDIGYEEDEYFYRKTPKQLRQTHRHQDVALLRDSDPASSAFSGEDEVTKVAELLIQALSNASEVRANSVASRLDMDIDSGRGLRGAAARISDKLRTAENGLDKIQRKNMGLSESRSFVAKRAMNEYADYEYVEATDEIYWRMLPADLDDVPDATYDVIMSVMFYDDDDEELGTGSASIEITVRNNTIKKAKVLRIVDDEAREVRDSRIKHDIQYAADRMELYQIGKL